MTGRYHGRRAEPKVQSAHTWHECNLTRRCTGPGYVFGFQRRFLRLRFLVFKGSLVLVRPPGDLGRWAARKACSRAARDFR